MIDIGVNLTNSRFKKDYQQMLERAQASGLAHLLITGTNIEESIAAHQLALAQPDFLSSTAGVHPHDADAVMPDFIEQLEVLAAKPGVKAIGECGLDFNRNFSTPENQVTVFKAQIALAEKLHMPLFLHQRDAFETWLALLAPVVDKVPAMVAHCFTGDKAQLQACVDLGMYVGITGWVCDERRGEQLQHALSSLPLERLLIETDAPYLTPRTIRPKPKSSRNEPSYLPYVVEKIASLLGVPEQLVITHSTENAQRVFGL